MRTYNNPILPGFYPDPSICRVEDDYYMVNSTFEYFPGVPIFHSKDLVNWRQIGHVLDRPSQLNLDGLFPSKGIYAPTIRYYNGLFYMITTLVNNKNEYNFIVTAEKPEGPWSDPYWLENAPGIDPSLFFDDDGRAYYVGAKSSKNQRYYGENDIWLRELDLNTMQLIGEEVCLWKGALNEARWPEGPHIYKVNGYYYLFIAESGTGHFHSVTVARGKDIKGTYLPNDANPILTHRHLGLSYPITNVGHCDIVQLQNGEWWMVLLASRPFGGYYRNLGRETFLVKMTWENDWPLVNPGKGVVEMTSIAPNLPEQPWLPISACDNFENEKLAMQWIMQRTPREQLYSLSERIGYLRINLRPQMMSENNNPSLICRRIQHMSFTIRTAMEFNPKNQNEVAGIVLLQNNNFYFSFEYAIEGDETLVRLIKCENGVIEILKSHKFNCKRLYLTVCAKEQDYNFYYGDKQDENILLIDHVDGRILSSEVASGFVGSCAGLYASSNGMPSDNTADFDWFEYLGK